MPSNGWLPPCLSSSRLRPALRTTGHRRLPQSMALSCPVKVTDEPTLQYYRTNRTTPFAFRSHQRGRSLPHSNPDACRGMSGVIHNVASYLDRRCVAELPGLENPNSPGTRAHQSTAIHHTHRRRFSNGQAVGSTSLKESIRRNSWVSPKAWIMYGISSI